jgi:tripartite-type tricarboxylate transporter receptor subunit TctC
VPETGSLATQAAARATRPPSQWHTLSVPLSQMSSQRSEVAPDVPTFKEQGFDIEPNSLRGTAAPKGLPEPVRERLVAAIAKVAANPEFQAKMKESYTPMRFLPPDEFAAVLQQAEAQFRALWQEQPWVEE